MPVKNDNTYRDLILKINQDGFSFRYSTSEKTLNAATEEKIREIIESVTTNWDSKNWNEAKMLFVDGIEIDYTSVCAPSMTKENIKD